MAMQGPQIKPFKLNVQSRRRDEGDCVNLLTLEKVTMEQVRRAALGVGPVHSLCAAPLPHRHPKYHPESCPGWGWMTGVVCEKVSSNSSIPSPALL